MKLVLALLLLFSCAGPAWAWTGVYSWTAMTGATSYKVEKSVDNQVTWTVVGTPATPAFTYTGTEAGITFFRVSACNAVGCVVRAADGLWHNEAAQLPFAPINITGQ